MLKGELLKPTFVATMECLDAARQSLEAELGPDVVRADPDRLRIDARTADGCLEPLRTRELELKDRYVHRLAPLWRAFKKQVGRAELNTFDGLINKASEWEEFRYPKFVRSRGKVVSFDPFKSPRTTSKSQDLINRYNLNREEIDELMSALITASGHGPHWVQMKVNAGQGAGRETYLRDNRHVIKGV